MTVTGIGNYSGKLTQPFTIQPKEIAESDACAGMMPVPSDAVTISSVITVLVMVSGTSNVPA